MRSEIASLAGRVAELLRVGDESDHQTFIATYLQERESSRPERDNRGRRQHDKPVLTEAAFVMPLIEAEINPMGGIKRVYLEYPDSFAEQMFLLGGKTIDSGRSK